MGRPRIKDKRFCYACGSDKTELKDGKWQHWYLNKDKDNNVLCHSCFSRHFYLPKYRSRRYTYRDQRIYEDEPSRTGVCSKCGKKIGDKYLGWRNKEIVIKETHLHHEFYLVICPWFSRIELCVACHLKIRWEEWKQTHTPEEKSCSLCGTMENYKSNSWRRHPNGNLICFKCWRKVVYFPRIRIKTNSYCTQR